MVADYKNREVWFESARDVSLENSYGSDSYDQTDGG